MLMFYSSSSSRRRVTSSFWLTCCLLLLPSAVRSENNNKNSDLVTIVQNDYDESSSSSLVMVDGSSCASITSCGNCSNTYSCHWCSHDEHCHAKGSIHGCSWGSSCNKPEPKPKENTTCASHVTCSECALSSHLCHWCEHDNACHAIGSMYGCTVGVDCYSNGRCRRDKPEPLSPFMVSEIPKFSLILILSVGALLVGCLSFCHCCLGNVKGAYDDLATMTVAASLPPSVIGGSFMMPGTTTQESFYQTLETHPEGNEGAEELQHGNSDYDAQEMNTNSPCHARSTSSTTRNGNDEEQPARHRLEQQEQRRHEECEPNHYVLINEGGGGTDSAPLLHPTYYSSARSFNEIPGMEEPRHMKALYRMCSCLYILGLAMVVGLVATSIIYYPKPPVYNVCNDSVAWKKIIENMVAMKLDASFEILISVSNPNHIDVALDKAAGSFTFEDKKIGTYQLPPATATAMSITDMMVIAKVEIDDKYLALQLGEAYYQGKLVLVADFNARVRAPSLFDISYDLHLKDIPIYVNKLGDRTLCHCPSWDESKNHSKPLWLLES